MGHDVLIARSGFRKGFLAGSSSKWAVQMGPRTPRLRDTKTFSFPTLACSLSLLYKYAELPLDRNASSSFTCTRLP